MSFVLVDTQDYVTRSGVTQSVSQRLSGVLGCANLQKKPVLVFVR